jgi:antitoxin (DNA-binding transcriptional repressor) of toxin-antitoxin stability system
MVKTVQEVEGHVAELVEQAKRGEDVLIAVDGRVEARLTAAPEAKSQKPFDGKKWVEELKALQQAYSTGKASPTSEEIVDELREERI